MKLRTFSDESAERNGDVLSSRRDGKVSASVGGGRGFSLEAGLSVDEATRRSSVSRSGHLAILGHGEHETPPHPSLSGLQGAGDRPSQAGGIDPGGKATTAEAHHVGEARVAAALVRAGDEQRSAGGRGEREATVRRSVPPPLRLDNGTLVSGERLGLRLSPLGPGADGEFDERDDDRADASDVGEIRDQSRRNRESLEEWATAARKNGRVDSPVPPDPPESSTREPTPGENSSSNKGDPTLLTPHGLKSARSRAHRALLASNVTDTLEMCENILQEWPSDGATLLYQGAAMAQSGEWDSAWNRMERVLALSSGVEELATVAASATVGFPTTFADDRQGDAQSSAGRVSAAGPPRAVAAAVPLDIALAAAANLASFARARAPETLDPNAETFFIVEGLRGAAERDRVGFERGNTPARSALPSSETSSSSSPSSSDENNKEDTGGGKAEESYTAGRIDGYVDLVVMMAQALEGKGQLTSALRLYQRAILLGGHRDPRALHGLGGLSRRLLEVERERTRRQSVIHSAATAPTQGCVPSPLSLPVPPLLRLDRHHVLQRPAGTGAATTSTCETGVAASRQHRPKSGCEWGITHPKPGQVFSPDDLVQVEFDLTLLDPGLPSAGSIFETVVVGSGAASTGGLLPEDLARESRGGGVTVVEDGLGVVVCSYLEGYKAVHCLPRGQLRDIGLGWHLLTAEAYQLPSLRPFSCPADGDAAGDDRVEYRCLQVTFCTDNIQLILSPM